MEFDDLSHRVIGCAIEIHRALGPGLLESAYEQCLARELAQIGIRFQLQYPQPFEYKGIHLDCGYRIDLLVEGGVDSRTQKRRQADGDSSSNHLVFVLFASFVV